jgi:hypothetical protein
MLFGREGHILHTCFYQNDHSVIRPAYAPFPPGHVVVQASPSPACLFSALSVSCACTRRWW